MRCRSRAKGQDIWLDPQVSMRRAARVRWGADGRQIFRPQLARLGQPCPFLRSDCLHGSAWSGCRCKNVFSYFYGWLCVLRVCACDSLNVCAHVDMRGSCCRARANRTMPPPTSWHNGHGVHTISANKQTATRCAHLAHALVSTTLSASRSLTPHPLTVAAGAIMDWHRALATRQASAWRARARSVLPCCVSARCF